MNLDHDFFLVSKSSEDQKKRSLPKMDHVFSPNSSGDLRSGAHQSQIIGRDADEDHTQIIGGDTVKLFGRYIPPIPPGFRHPCWQLFRVSVSHQSTFLIIFLNFLSWSMECFTKQVSSGERRIIRLLRYLWRARTFSDRKN